MIKMKAKLFSDVCNTLAAVRCLNAGQTLAQVAKSAKVSPQQVLGWLHKGGFRKITFNGKAKYVVA